VTEPAIAESLLLVLRESFEPEEVARIDRVWLFPPRRIRQRDSSVAVISMIPHDAPERRRLLTLHHLRPTPGATAPEEDHIVEQGTTPADRVDALVRGVLMRIRDAVETPREEEIAGDRTRWIALVGGEPAA
jgi:hypothetical protein